MFIANILHFRGYFKIFMYFFEQYVIFLRVLIPNLISFYSLAPVLSDPIYKFMYNLLRISFLPKYLYKSAANNSPSGIF